MSAKKGSHTLLLIHPIAQPESARESSPPFFVNCLLTTSLSNFALLGSLIEEFLLRIDVLVQIFSPYERKELRRSQQISSAEELLLPVPQCHANHDYIKNHLASNFRILFYVFHQIERYIYDHIFLSADHFAFAQFDQYGACVDPIFAAGLFGMAQEAGIDPSIA